ncbi:MAG: hypothetical protein ACK50Q_17765 [Labrys sp. (in: a-proteobacteria)]
MQGKIYTFEEKKDEVDANPGFKVPADRITVSCFEYMARIMELRSFIGFFFDMVKSSQKLSEEIPAIKEEAVIYKLVQYDYSSHRQLVNEIFLSRSVESFDLYLQRILESIFLSKPEILKSEGKIEISTVIDFKSSEDLIAYIAGRKINELSYKSLDDLSKYIKNTTGLDLFENEEIYYTILLASEIRNLIAHNDCKVNERFLSKTKTIQEQIGVSDHGKIIISDEWVRTASYILDGAVFRLDELAAAKFSLKTSFRYGMFIIRE